MRAERGFSCRGSLWADGNSESFISPCYAGEGAGRGRPRKFGPSQDKKQDEHHQQDDEEDDNCTPLPSIWKEKGSVSLPALTGKENWGRAFLRCIARSPI